MNDTSNDTLGLPPEQQAIRAAELMYKNGHILHGGIGVGLEYPLHLFTQQIAGFAVRAGAMNEMVARTVDSMNLQVAG